MKELTTGKDQTPPPGYKCKQKGGGHFVKHKNGVGSLSALTLVPGKDLVILIDSAAAIKRLTWFRRKDFRPHPTRTAPSPQRQVSSTLILHFL